MSIQPPTISKKIKKKQYFYLWSGLSLAKKKNMTDQQFLEWKSRGLFPHHSNLTEILDDDLVFFSTDEITTLITETNYIKKISTSQWGGPLDTFVQLLIKTMKIEEVTLSSISRTDNIIDRLSKCFSIKTLHIKAPQSLSKTNLSSLEKYPFLKTLTIDTVIGYGLGGFSNISGLYKCPLLETVAFRSCELLDADIKTLPRCLSLKKLQFHYCNNISNKILEYISQCPLLEYLELNDCHNYNDSGIEFITRMPRLETFHCGAHESIKNIRILTKSTTIVNLLVSTGVYSHYSDKVLIGKTWQDSIKNFNEDKLSTIKDTVMKTLTKMPEALVNIIAHMAVEYRKPVVFLE